MAGTAERSYSDRAYWRQAKRAQRARKRREKSASPAIPDVDLCAWIEGELKVPTGPLFGQPFRLGDWQRDFLAGALGPGIREAGLSVARKNGKSGLIAALLLAYLVGPLRSANWRAVVTSLTAKLAAELRDAIEGTANVSGFEEAVTVRRSPSPGHILGPDGTRIDFLAADKATGHGVGADLALIDESGLLEENARPLWNAMLSSVSARDGRMISISIMGDGPLFRELQERAEARTVYWQEHTAPRDCALDDREAWAAANPGLADGIKSLSYMVDMAERAASLPADAGLFRLYDLNTPGAGIEATAVPLSEWQACLAATLPAASGPCFLGVDLGGSSSMTAACAFWPATGRLQAWGGFAGVPDLLTRGRGDGVGNRYELMQGKHELMVYEGQRSTPVKPFLLEVAARLGDAEIRKVLADDYRKAEFEDVISYLAENEVRWPFEVRKTAVKEGNEDLIAFQRAVKDGRLQTVESLLLASSISDSRVDRDSWGNIRLQKKRHAGRIDALQAAVLAVAAGMRHRKKKGGPRRFLFV